jgi:hypothetical protein
LYRRYTDPSKKLHKKKGWPWNWPWGSFRLLIWRLFFGGGTTFLRGAMFSHLH